MKLKTETFELTHDNKLVTVKATAFQTVTSETRYRVSINNSPVHIFALNDSINRYQDIDSGAAAKNIPLEIEEAIGKRLYNSLAA